MNIKASELTVGMKFIPAGRKHPVEVVMAGEVYPQTGLRTLGIYGRGFTAMTIQGNADVIVIAS